MMGPDEHEWFSRFQEELAAQTYWGQKAAEELRTIKTLLGFLLFFVGAGVLLLFTLAIAAR